MSFCFEKLPEEVDDGQGGTRKSRKALPGIFVDHFFGLRPSNLFWTILGLSLFIAVCVVSIVVGYILVETTEDKVVIQSFTTSPASSVCSFWKVDTDTVDISSFRPRTCDSSAVQDALSDDNLLLRNKNFTVSPGKCIKGSSGDGIELNGVTYSFIRSTNKILLFSNEDGCFGNDYRGQFSLNTCDYFLEKGTETVIVSDCDAVLNRDVTALKNFITAEGTDYICVAEFSSSLLLRFCFERENSGKTISRILAAPGSTTFTFTSETQLFPRLIETVKADMSASSVLTSLRSIAFELETCWWNAFISGWDGYQYIRSDAEAEAIDQNADNRRDSENENAAADSKGYQDIKKFQKLSREDKMRAIARGIKAMKEDKDLKDDDLMAHMGQFFKRQQNDTQTPQPTIDELLFTNFGTMTYTFPHMLMEPKTDVYPPRAVAPFTWDVSKTIAADICSEVNYNFCDRWCETINFLRPDQLFADNVDPEFRRLVFSEDQDLCISTCFEQSTFTDIFNMLFQSVTMYLDFINLIEWQNEFLTKCFLLSPGSQSDFTVNDDILELISVQCLYQAEVDKQERDVALDRFNTINGWLGMLQVFLGIFIVFSYIIYMTWKTM